MSVKEQWGGVEFTRDQMNEINEGLRAGLDVAAYAQKEFLAIQMHEIRLGMLAGVDVSCYAKPEYDWFQMEEIREGLKSGVDITKFASPELPYDKMRQIRRGLEDGIDLSAYTRLEAGTLRELRKGIRSGVNLVPYIQQNYQTEQLRQIRIALEKGVNIAPYIKPEFLGVSINEIMLGLECGLDVTIYARTGMSWQQMREIRLGLEHRLDISVYQNPLYGWQQMREIRLGLEEGLPVSDYSSLMYTAKEMRKRRLRLENDYLDELIGEKEAAEVFQDFRVIVSSDEMEAYIEIQGNPKTLSQKKIRAALRQSGVKEGIIEDAIGILVDGGWSVRSVKVAEGRPAQTGKDGWYELFFEYPPRPAPTILPDGSVDYTSAKYFEVVEAGQRLALYHEASEGTPGMTVTGKKLAAKKGKEQNLLTGKGFVLQGDNKTYLAAYSGKVSQEGNRLVVEKMLVLGDVNLLTSQVNFDGCVYVKGNVAAASTIIATEDIIVDGFVEGANIQSGGSIVLRKGANAAGGSGCIRAKRDVSGKFFESISVFVGGNIKANYCLNCDIYSEGTVEISGTRGMIAGGKTYALRSISAHNIGNRARLVSVFSVGVNETLLRQEVEVNDKIVNVESELRILINSQENFQKKYPPEIRNTMDIYLKIESAVYTKELQMKQLILAKESIEQKKKDMENAKLCVRGMVFEGAVIEINGQRLYAKEMSNVTIRRNRGSIGIFRN